MGRQDEGIKG